MTNQNHPFHLVSPSPWPIIISLSIFNNFLFIISWFHNLTNIFNNSSFYFCSTTPYLIISLPNTLMCMYMWWRDVTRESTFQGCHSIYVHRGMKMGMILFIISEIFFFISFFWAYFHSSLSPSIEIGQLWPPRGISPFNPFDIPLMNTIILISSGLTVTWAHHSLINSNKKETKKSLWLTIILGFYFSLLQLFEYLNASFTMADSIYGSTFFIATGFHGIHVIIGTLFLFITLIRLYKMHFSTYHHFGFEAASWYWHFVDVIWLFLFLSIYWWSF